MNNRGSVVMGVLMIIAFSLLVGVPVLQAANIEHKAAINDQMDAQAFYLAEAGIQHVKVEALAELNRLVAEGWLPSDGIASPFATVTRDNYGPGDYDASAYLIDNGDGTFSIRLESNGIVGGTTGLAKGTRITFPLVTDGSGGSGGTPGGDAGGSLVDMAVFAAEKIRMDSQPIINGNVITNATSRSTVSFANNTIRINGTLQVGAGADPDNVINWPYGVPHTTIVSGGEPQAQLTNRAFPAVDFPAFPTKAELGARTDINLDSPMTNRVAEILSDGWYNKIRMNGDSTHPAKLIIHAPAGTTRVLRVKTLEFNNLSEVTIVGGGKVEIYVDGSIDFRNQLKVNDAGTIDQLTIYCAGDRVQFTNNAIFRGTLICESADLNINSSVCHIYGSVITGFGDVDISNANNFHDMLVYAPNGKVSIVSSSKLNGAVICDEFYMTWGCVINYDPAVKYALGGGGGGSSIDFGDSIWAPTR